ncbi:MAG: hypothetical protein A3A82_01875 [Candidatus Pacebacteria bacterium RIFCSPLOWO2_01_FULL_47_12]|nr:MAG: hypothetical protein A3A82_01875 [Candidatus Pacebacteria bacterium RIFCSPLOWO2_01_FULL_47_12]
MSKNIMYKRQTYGFTFIELLVSATIIIVLSVIGVVSFAKAGKSARDARRRADLAMVQQAMVQYKVNEGTGEYPAGDFATVVGTLHTNGYLSSSTITDPKSSTYNYACDPSCTDVGFTITAYSEVAGDYVTILFKNP